jgi:hypothetical protein
MPGQPKGAIMPDTGLTSPPLRELAHRTSSGTDVTLLWNEHTGALTVSVRSRGTGAQFQFTAEPDQALHAFYHPYAYAAARAPRADAPLASRR